MTDYTPNTGQVRNAYGAHMGDCRRVTSNALEEFDRWLTNHDRLVEAATLRKAASDPEIQDNRPWVEWWLLNRINALEES